MKKICMSSLFCIGLALLLSGCATKGDISEYVGNYVIPNVQELKTNIQNDLKEINKRQDEIQKDIKMLETALTEDIKPNLISLESDVSAWKEKSSMIRDESSKSLEEVITMKKDINSHLDDLKKSRTTLGELGEQISSIEQKVNNNLDSINTKNTSQDLEIQDINKNLEKTNRDLSDEITNTGSQLGRRIDNTNDSLRVFRNHTTDNIKIMRNSLEEMAESIYNILSLQRKQFESMTNAYDNSINRLQPHRPSEVLKDLKLETEESPENETE